MLQNFDKFFLTKHICSNLESFKVLLRYINML